MKANEVQLVLADIVSVFHALVVAFVLLTPFLTNIPYFLFLHATFGFSLLIHWYFNSNVCFLSVVESKLRGLDYTQSFTHQFIAPVYDISKTTWSNVSYSITLFVIGLSIYKLSKSKRMKQAIECFNDQETKSMQKFVKCMQLLFFTEASYN
jgi:hypothetical protein